MKLMPWLREMFNGHPDPRDRVAEAMKATEELTVSVRSLREQIQPYALTADPFAAMMHAHSLARDYAKDHR